MIHQENIVLQEVTPRLRAGIGSSSTRAGGEDDLELLQDGLVIALGLLQSAERRGKQVTVGNIAYYTLKHLNAGRRSTGVRKNDALHPASKLNGCRVYSLDEPVSGADEDGEAGSLADVLASAADDPAVEAGRRLDWQALWQKLDEVAKAILRALVDGSELTRLVSSLKLSRSSLQTRKNQLAELIREYLGEDILRQVQEHPGWRNGLEATRERIACRWARQAA